MEDELWTVVQISLVVCKGAYHRDGCSFGRASGRYYVERD
ncbi:uncharacterized protein G2W53_014627 [Senna tora]|uniref:Uncharacterized protein n=1 Tax=Senna tora TaxID=362788 RepID=A0A834WU26_9FABA|nr:uncharacterized protein G2W53_014627 [Senna tora]